MCLIIIAFYSFLFILNQSVNHLQIEEEELNSCNRLEVLEVFENDLLI